jgi:hypothetical protein
VSLKVTFSLDGTGCAVLSERLRVVRSQTAMMRELMLALRRRASLRFAGLFCCLRRPCSRLEDASELGEGDAEERFHCLDLNAQAGRDRLMVDMLVA